MYKFFLCLRYLRRRRIAFFAVAAVCLCVAMVLIVFSVMDGFLRMVRNHSRGMLGDLVMENQSFLQGFYFYDEFIDELKNAPEVGPYLHQITPVIYTYGVARYPEWQRTMPTQICGIRLAEYYEVNDFKKGLFYEKYYPGTTTLNPQKVPGCAATDDGTFRLPEEIEAAWQKWWASASPEERVKAPIEKELPYKRVGRYWPVPLDEQLASGKPGPKWYGPDLPGIILGTDMCAQRNEKGEYERFHYRGEEVQLTLVPILESGQIKDATGMPSRLFRFSDDCRTGVYDIDSMASYIDFDVLQRILLMDRREVEIEDPDGGTHKEILPARASQVQVKLKPDADVLAIRDAIQTRWAAFAEQRQDQVRNPGLLTRVRVLTWEEKQADFIQAVEKEKYLVTILFGIISVVAVLLVGCIFYMIVQQKTRDIGIVKSVGATSLGVAGIFIAYGAAVGVVGGAIGTVIGVVFVHYINEIQELLAWINPRAVVWDPKVYIFDRIPNEVSFWHATVIYAVAIFASMVGSLIAARKAAKVWPVEALRYE
jgi:lipoprotein-releasing system permease protein